MKFIGLIPARYASTRFPGKPLALLAGKPVIQHVYEQVEEEANASQLVTKIKMVYDNPSAMYLFDQELKQRVFVPDAGN